MNATLNATPETSTASLITDAQAATIAQQPTLEEKYIDELISRLAQRDLDVARAERQLRLQTQINTCGNQALLRSEALRDKHVALAGQQSAHIANQDALIKKLDAKCLKLTTRLAAAQDKADDLAEQNAVLRNRIKTDAYVHDSDKELIADVKNGIKYTGIMLLIICVLAGLYRCEGEPVRVASHVASGVAK
jgi:uncharacterized coiled-coil protein SlyX